LAGGQKGTRWLLLALKLFAPARKVKPERALGHALQAGYLAPRDADESRQREPLREPDPLKERQALRRTARGQPFRQDRCQL
jgi:hypothetical protein